MRAAFKKDLSLTDGKLRLGVNIFDVALSVRKCKTWIPGPRMNPIVWKSERKEVCVVLSEIRVAEDT